MISIRTLSRSVVAAVMYYTSAVTLLHFLEPGVDSVANPMSAYVGTDSATLMTTTYFAMAAGIACLALGLRRMLGSSSLATTGLILFFVSALASGLAGAFPGEAPPPRTLSGIIHLTCGAIYSFAMAAAIVLITLVLRKDARWRAIRKTVAWIAAGVVISTFLFPVLAPLGGGGIAQRVGFGLHFIWMAIVALQLSRVAT